MRIERPHRQHIAHRRKRDVDHEHEGDQPVGERDRPAEHHAPVGADELAEAGRYDRQHEG